jgi:glutamate 5-kinase
MSHHSSNSPRESISQARRIVVKIGSSSLSSREGGLKHNAIEVLAQAVAARRAQGHQVIVVSSGAISTGMPALNLTKRPKDLATQQAAASVGQGILLAAYTSAFREHGITVGQVLLTSDDVTRRSHYRNAQRTFDRLLDLNVLPIVNENDTVATDEIRLGDNDRLAALVAHVTNAEALVLLSDVDGLYDGPPHKAGSIHVPEVSHHSELESMRIGGIGAEGVGSGGMATKVQAARIASAAGVPTLLAATANIEAALGDASTGTAFAATGRRSSLRLLWLQHATTPTGSVTVDAGAVAALVDRRLSLLPAGITQVTGTFVAGEPVDICGPDGVPFARGLVTYDSGELPEIIGRNTKELAAERGEAYEREVIHRDDLVITDR